MDNILEFIHREKPDIITCQEANNGMVPDQPPRSLHTLQIFSDEFAYNYIFSPQILWMKEPKIEQGLATFSRFPIEKMEEIFFDTKYRYYPMVTDRTDWRDYPSSLAVSKVKIPSGTITVINVHGLWGFDGKDNAKRDTMIDLIVEKIEDEKRVILAGDFNMNPDTRAIERLETHISNVFDRELKTTFNVKRKPQTGGWSTAVVDMMFVSPDIQVLEHSCPQVDISDHLPLLATIEI